MKRRFEKTKPHAQQRAPKTINRSRLADAILFALLYQGGKR